jgi:hypothetical protein
MVSGSGKATATRPDLVKGQTISGTMNACDIHFSVPEPHKCPASLRRISRIRPQSRLNQLSSHIRRVSDVFVELPKL